MFCRDQMSGVGGGLPDCDVMAAVRSDCAGRRCRHPVAESAAFRASRAQVAVDLALAVARLRRRKLAIPSRPTRPMLMLPPASRKLSRTRPSASFSSVTASAQFFVRASARSEVLRSCMAAAFASARWLRRVASSSSKRAFSSISLAVTIARTGTPRSTVSWAALALLSAWSWTAAVSPLRAAYERREASASISTRCRRCSRSGL